MTSGNVLSHGDSALLAGRHVAAGAIDTHYIDAGDGDPVLLLHGSGPGVTAAANWEPTIAGLAPGFRVVAPEMVGYGSTERPDHIVYGVPTWIDHVIDFLDALDIANAHFVGNSMGGLVAMHIARLHPGRVGKLVLMGAPHPGMTPTAGLAALRAYEPSLEAMRRLLVENFAYDGSLITDALVDARYRASAAPGVHESYRAMFHDPKHSGNQLELTDDGVRAIAASTLVVHGAHDKVIPVEAGWHLSRLIDDCDLHVFARCGHWTQIERPDEFNALVTAFLTREASH